MRKWRPTYRAIYVVSELCGNIQSLEVILNRILPLRKFVNQEDIVIFMGDYIDGMNGGPEVLDALINVKKEYGDRAIILKGNHEDMLVRATYGSDDDFNNWIASNGLSTIEGYVKRSAASVPAASVSRTRLSNLIPKAHIEFIRSMVSYHVIDNMIFFHGSFDHKKTIAENDVNNFVYDYTASKMIKECLGKGQIPEYKDDYIYIGCHNYNSSKPVITDRYIMLGGSSPEKIIVLELNSMECVAVTRGKSRIYPYELEMMV